MKVAIIHDWLTALGGAEKVLRELLTLYPNADLFSVIDFLSEKERQEILGKKAKTSFIQKLPFAKRAYKHYLPLMPLAIENFDLKGYDLLLSSSHAVAKGVIPLPHQLHICYCHTPLRYAWDLRHEYLETLDPIKRVVAAYFLHRIRQWDVVSSNRVDAFVANSQFVAQRIKKIYRREAEVIHCGIDTDFFAYHEKKEDYYVTASRLVPYKKIDLIVKAFSQMKDRRLIVLGEGPELRKLAKMATSNVTFLGYQSKERLRDIVQKAKAFIFAALEDFGIAPLEALSCGTPVIAFSGGGAKESLGDVGHFFYEQSENAVRDAVLEFEGSDPLLCRKRAEEFSLENFRKKMGEFINREWYEKHHFGGGKWEASLASITKILPEAIPKARKRGLTSSKHSPKARKSHTPS